MKKIIDEDLVKYKEINQEEASNLCGHDGIRNEKFNIVGNRFFIMKDSEWKFIKEWKQK